MKNYFYLICLVLLAGCQPQTNNESESGSHELPETVHHSATITKVLNAHGGINQWYSLRRLSYDKANEHHTVELRSRKVKVETEKWAMGSDGKNVWISPVENEYRGNPRFYHNLYFYFFAMPFVLGDPGVFYEDMEPKELLGKTYNAIKISYGDGIGDSPKDNYILYYDPETYRMEWLMYTVTFRSQESSDRFNLIKYEDWNEMEGVILPSKLTWYQYQNQEIGSPRNEVVFENVVLSKEQPEDSMFEMPEDSKIVEMPNSDN